MQFTDSTFSRDDLFGGNTGSNYLAFTPAQGHDRREQQWEDKKRQAFGGQDGYQNLNVDLPMRSRKEKKQVKFNLPVDKVKKEMQKEQQYRPQGVLDLVPASEPSQVRLFEGFGNTPEQMEDNHEIGGQSFMVPQDHQAQTFYDLNASLNSTSSDGNPQSKSHKFSPIPKRNPNMKFVPTANFVAGEGAFEEDPDSQQFLMQKVSKENHYMHELQAQIDEKKRKRDDEKNRLRQQELLDEQRYQQQLMDMANKTREDDDRKKAALGEVMDKYDMEEETRKMQEGMLKDKKGPIIVNRTAPVNTPMHPGAEGALYRYPGQTNPHVFDNGETKYDVMDRGYRSAITGVPKAKLLADIGHDLRKSVQWEVENVRNAIMHQRHDFHDQLKKLDIEAKKAGVERDKARSHLQMMRQEVDLTRQHNFMYEKDLNKALEKYKPDPRKAAYPVKPRHLEYRFEKPEEKKTIYEKMFFDKIENKIEGERMEVPLLPPVTHMAPRVLPSVTIGPRQYYADSQGLLNTDSTLVTLDNQTLYPSKSLSSLPTFSSKSRIVTMKPEPFEHYDKPKMNERDEMYIIRSDILNKHATRLSHKEKVAVPEIVTRDRDLPLYGGNQGAREMQHINLEKIHQANEQRLKKLTRDGPITYSRSDQQMLNDIISGK